MTSVLAVNVGGSYVDLPDPAYDNYKTYPNEISKADRNTLGNLIKQRITVKQSISVKWVGLTAEQKTQIVDLVGGDNFQLKYLCLENDQFQYGKFYTGNDMEIRGYGKFDGRRFTYYDLTATFVEY